MTSDPTRPELRLLKLLWRRKQLSAREIQEQLGRELGWSQSTTRTTLERMVGKGFLHRGTVHGVVVYAPAVEKVALLGRLIRDFTTRVLEVEEPLPATLFASSKLLTEKELRSLEALLEQEEEQDARDRREPES